MKEDGIQRTEYEGMLRFERLLADLSARFINLPADRVDAEIDAALRAVCASQDIDGATLWQIDAEHRETLLISHSHMPADAPPIPKTMDAKETFPWCLENLRHGETLVLPRVADTPPAATRDRDLWRHFGIQSALIFPLSAGGGSSFGAVSFIAIRAEREWLPDIVDRLRQVAQVFANAIVRRRAEQMLRESGERLALATAAADAGLWVMNPSGTSFWVTAKTMEILGLPPGDTLDMPRFLERVHPADRERVGAAIRQALDSEALTDVEYRIVRPDGQIRWVHSQGRRSVGDRGGPFRLMGISSDITASQEREEQLRSSEARVAAAIEVAGLGFYETGADGQVAFLDARIRELIGVPPEEKIDGRTYWLAHIHPDDQLAVGEASRRIQTGGLDRVDIEYRYLHPERGTLWFQHLAQVRERNAEGRAIRAVGVFRDITEQKHALDEVRGLRDRLETENSYLREQVLGEAGHGAIVGESPPILKMLALARKVAPEASAVLITGETGTGKELLAQAIHDQSTRKQRPMVKVNCAALPATLIESELFGREKGAYTGAMTQQAGRFQIADGSTIFLDEIGDLPLDLQVKLLRVLQDGKYERLGSHQTLRADVRVIAATNRDLAAMVKAGSFREDLFHRLNVFPIEVPPLRARGEDIPLLVWKFVQEFNMKMGRSIDSIPKQTLEQLKQYLWPGNVRELRNLIERAMILIEGRVLKIEFPSVRPDSGELPTTLEELERGHIMAVLERTRWRISGKRGAAEILGLIPTTLHSRMRKLGISRPSS